MDFPSGENHPHRKGKEETRLSLLPRPKTRRPSILGEDGRHWTASLREVSFLSPRKTAFPLLYVMGGKVISGPLHPLFFLPRDGEGKCGRRSYRSIRDIKLIIPCLIQPERAARKGGGEGAGKGKFFCFSFFCKKEKKRKRPMTIRSGRRKRVKELTHRARGRKEELFQ